MFMCSGNSPKVPPRKGPRQTSIDSYSRPSTRLARKEAEGKETRAAKSGSRQKAGQDPQQATLSAEDGWAFLEDEAIIDSAE